MVPATSDGALAASRALLSVATVVVVVKPAATSASGAPTVSSGSRPSARVTPHASGGPDGGPPDLSVAGKVALALGIPLFVEGRGLREELDRLQTRTVIGYPAEGLDVGSRQVIPGPGSVDEMPELDGLPAQAQPTAVLVLASTELSAPVAATVAASGARPVPIGYPHPGVTGESTNSVKEHPGAVVGLGSGFGTNAQFAARLAMTRTAAELPGGGVLPFPTRRMIALYGHPQTAAMGMLGEQPPGKAVARLKKLVAHYQSLMPNDLVSGAFEIITTVASSSPGRDGDYSYETPIDVILPWIETAEANGIYVVLDLQPGRTDFLTQAKRYKALLKRPWVGLALDPEWRLKPHQKHLVSIGQVRVDEVNKVGAWLADLVKAENLPPKVLTLHQFQTRMIIDRHRLDTTRDEVQYLVHFDSQDTQPVKQSEWAVIKKDLPPRVWLGWKNFEHEDKPMLTPAQTVKQVKPTPNFISYQ